MSDVEVTPIPKIFRCYSDTKANLDVLPGLKTGDLGYGTDTALLYRWNGAAWAAITTNNVTNNGSYAGNSSGAIRGIAHSMGKVPKQVLIHASNGANTYSLIWILQDTKLVQFNVSASPVFSMQYATVTARDTTNFYVGGVGDVGNDNTCVYYWVSGG